MDDLSYDELVWHEQDSPVGPLLTGLAVLVVALLGAPQVWGALVGGDLDWQVAFFALLVAALVPVLRSRR